MASAGLRCSAAVTSLRIARMRDGKVAEDFGDADDGDFGVVGDDVDAGGAHLRATHAEDFYVGALLDSGGEAGGVHVAGGFAGGE